MQRVHGFAPIADQRARVLILGSMPGVASLRLQQYYGHPQNAFWRIMGQVLDFDATLCYARRRAALRRRHVAVWDVLTSCEREGSLDSDIDPHSIEVNDFGAFFAQHPRIHRVCFNGARAESLFRRQVLPRMVFDGGIVFARLPSTSPAHAGMPFAAKVAAWKAALAPAG